MPSRTRDDERTRSLAQQKLVSAAAVDASQARMNAARATRDAAAAELARARSALQPAERMAGGAITVRAPVSGHVLRVPQKSESVVHGRRAHRRTGRSLACRGRRRIPLAGRRSHAPGQTATIENWGGAPLAATVERIEPVARTKISALGVEEQRTNVILQFTDREAAQRLGHDYRVDARVVVDTSVNAVRAPLGALFRRGQQWSVYQVVEGSCGAEGCGGGNRGRRLPRSEAGPGRR